MYYFNVVKSLSPRSLDNKDILRNAHLHIHITGIKHIQLNYWQFLYYTCGIVRSCLKQFQLFVHWMFFNHRYGWISFQMLEVDKAIVVLRRTEFKALSYLCDTNLLYSEVCSLCTRAIYDCMHRSSQCSNGLCVFPLQSVLDDSLYFGLFGSV